MLASGNLGPCLGPVIGAGTIFATGQPVWCFRVLVILGGVSSLLIGWTLPETNRRVVGNGTVHPAGIWRTWWSILDISQRNQRMRKRVPDAREKHDALHLPRSNPSEPQRASDPQITGRGKLIFPNPFSSLSIIFSRNTFLILFLAASPYSVWYLIQTSIPTIYGQSHDGYAFSDVEVGLCYLAGGFGVIAGGFIAGRLMDWNFKVVARQAGLPINSWSGGDGMDFPFETARSRGTIVILSVSACAIAGFGWAVQYRVHPSVPLILQSYIGAKCTILHQMYSALLVDIFPDQPSTAAASNNIVRCALSAAAVAALQPLVDAIGRAWFFFSIALLDAGLCLVAVLLLRKWGMHWRRQ
jgi:hypothetical protein